MDDEESLKLRTARSVKWNAIDRLSSQMLYALTGVILANVLTPDEFGLVGAVLIFQAFALVFVDSGFSFALIQRKDPDRLDYSSVLWFNMLISTSAYILLFMAAPMIAGWFGDSRLIHLSRVMFLSIILNASSIVQVNRLVKEMNVKPVACADIVALAAAGAVGVILALRGFGAWAMVWQTIVNTGLKSAIIWGIGRWTPLPRMSLAALRRFISVGGAVMATSILNTVFNYIYSFFIGIRAGLAPLGYYTQGDKWSKMGITSISQTLTSSFIPALSQAQDDMPRFRNMCGRMHRTTAYVVYPVMIGLVMMAAPIFHTLFGNKWDASVFIFQLLLIRGVFTIFTGLYNNFLIALGRSRQVLVVEVVRDATALVALAATLPFLGADMPGDEMYGIRILVYGQIIAGVAAWTATLSITCRVTGMGWWSLVGGSMPYIALTSVIAVPVYLLLGHRPWPAVLILAAEAGSALALYLLANRLLGSRIQAETLTFISGKMKK